MSFDEYMRYQVTLDARVTLSVMAKTHDAAVEQADFELSTCVESISHYSVVRVTEA